MSARNALEAASEDQTAAGDEKSPAGNFSVVKSKHVASAEPAGSIWSHLSYGVATLALIAPLFLPGISMNKVAVFYLALMGIVLVGCVISYFIEARPPRR